MRLIDELKKRLTSSDALESVRQTRLDRVNRELTQRLAQQMFDEWKQRHLSASFYQLLTGSSDDTNWSDLTSFASDKDITKKYEIVAIIYLVIRKIAWKISTTPLVVVSPAGDKVEDHPLLDKLRMPNPDYDGVALLERSVTYLEGLGKFFWEIKRNSRGNILQINCPEAWKIEPVKGEKREIGGFKVLDDEGKPVRAISADDGDLLYVRYFHPTQPWKGFPPIQAARMEIQTMISATMYNKAFFDNSATINLFLETEKAVKEDEAISILRQFEERHQTPSKAFKPALLPLGLKAKALALTHQDMEFLAQDRNYRHKICSIFDTPLAIVGFYESDYSAARSVGVQNYMEAWWHQCLIPRMTKILAALNRTFAKDLGEEFELAFDLSDERSLQSNQAEMAKTAKLMMGTGVSIDEIRAMVYNLPPLDNGEGKIVYLPAGLIPAGSVEATSGDTIVEGIGSLMRKINQKVVTSKGLSGGTVDWNGEKLLRGTDG